MASGRVPDYSVGMGVSCEVSGVNRQSVFPLEVWHANCLHCLKKKIALVGFLFSLLNRLFHEISFRSIGLKNFEKRKFCKTLALDGGKLQKRTQPYSY